jgi:hypothetical protein
MRRFGPLAQCSFQRPAIETRNTRGRRLAGTNSCLAHLFSTPPVTPQDPGRDPKKFTKTWKVEHRATFSFSAQAQDPVLSWAPALAINTYTYLRSAVVQCDCFLTPTAFGSYLAFLQVPRKYLLHLIIAIRQGHNQPVIAHW